MGVTRTLLHHAGLPVTALRAGVSQYLRANRPAGLQCTSHPARDESTTELFGHADLVLAHDDKHRPTE